jgi:hypothetical protein
MPLTFSTTRPSRKKFEALRATLVAGLKASGCLPIEARNSAGL